MYTLSRFLFVTIDVIAFYFLAMKMVFSIPKISKINIDRKVIMPPNSVLWLTLPL